MVEHFREAIRLRLEDIILKLQYEIDDYICAFVSDIGYDDISVSGCMNGFNRLRSHVAENMFPIADEEIEKLFNFVLEFIKKYGYSEYLISSLSLLGCHISFHDNLLDSDEQRLNDVLSTPFFSRVFRKNEYTEEYKDCFANVARHQAQQLLLEYISTQFKFREQQLSSNVVCERATLHKEAEQVGLRLKEQERETWLLREKFALLVEERDSLHKEAMLGESRLMEQEREIRFLRAQLERMEQEKDVLRNMVEQAGSHLQCQASYSEEGGCLEDLPDCDGVSDADLGETHGPCVTYVPRFDDKKSVVMDGNDKEVYDRAYSSVFAPAEVKKKSHLLTQIYLHLYEDSEKVISLSQKADRNSERRDYVPLSVNIRRGAKVDVEFCIYGETKLMDKRVSSIWQGDFLKFSFDYFVPQNIDVEELCCEAIVFVEGMMIGEMRFITQIVENPKVVAPKVVSHCFKRIFISYAHKDEQQVKFIAAAYKAQGVDYFYDSHYLAPSDVYEEKIFDYIDNADLFVLCWSKNAADSEYVSREVERALQHAYPQVCKENATIKIYPLNIEPYADLPDNILKVYHYGFV